MTSVEVFKTNVDEEEKATQILSKLLAHFPHYRINFDLQDCDRVLRVEGVRVSYERIIELVSREGVECRVLE